MSGAYRLKITATCVVVVCASYCMMRCKDGVSQGTSNVADSTRRDSMRGSGNTAVMVPPQLIDYSKFCGEWIKYDTVYRGRITSPDAVLKDTTRLRQKIDDFRNTGKCDGGCIFSSTYEADGSLHKRIDDYGKELRYCIDTANNKMVLLAGGKRRAKPDTINLVEITYLDDKYLMEYYINRTEPGTIFYHRAGNRK